MSDAPAPAVPPPITSRADFAAAVLWGVQAAVARQARVLWWVDRNFADWPLSDASLLEQLTPWLRLPQRRLVLLASSYDDVPARHPRFVRWRADWSHAIEAWAPPEELATGLPCLLVDDGPVLVQLHDAQRWRGRASLEVRDALLWRQQLDVLLQRSAPAFPVRQLGL
jgi:hypothetical protein